VEGDRGKGTRHKNLVKSSDWPPAGCKKGRELRTVSRRRAYSPEGFFISPLPTLCSRTIHQRQGPMIGLDKA
jgi:hypothetical protein